MQNKKTYILNKTRLEARFCCVGDDHWTEQPNGRVYKFQVEK